jgi:hypothetical protein
MAEQHDPQATDTTVEKAVWGFAGTTVLWLALFFSGVAIERLGLTSSILSGVIPGEVGSLRNQATECDKNLGTIRNDRDNLKQTEAALRVEIKKLKDQLAAKGN